jgi:hypothetical protein
MYVNPLLYISFYNMTSPPRANFGPKGRGWPPPVPPGPIPTTVNYNASVVKIYNATFRLVRFKTKNLQKNFTTKNFTTRRLALCVFKTKMLSSLKQRSSLLQRCRRSCKYGSRRLGFRTVPSSRPTIKGGRIFPRSNLAVFCFNFICDFYPPPPALSLCNYSFLSTTLLTRLIWSRLRGTRGHDMQCASYIRCETASGSNNIFFNFSARIWKTILKLYLQ